MIQIIPTPEGFFVDKTSEMTVRRTVSEWTCCICYCKISDELAPGGLYTYADKHRLWHKELIHMDLLGIS
jgi:hypothetical protein